MTRTGFVPGSGIEWVKFNISARRTSSVEISQYLIEKVANFVFLEPHSRRRELLPQVGGHSLYAALRLDWETLLNT